MRAVVVYESMYGNTHLVAAAIGEGLAMGDGLGDATRYRSSRSAGLILKLWRVPI